MNTKLARLITIGLVLVASLAVIVTAANVDTMVTSEAGIVGAIATAAVAGGVAEGHAIAGMKALLTTQLQSDYGLGETYCGSAMNDEGCAILTSCTCDSPLTCDKDAGSCVQVASYKLCTGACRAPVWIWIITAVVILGLCTCCFCMCRRRRQQTPLLVIGGAGVNNGQMAPMHHGGYAPPPQVYATPVQQPYAGSPYNQGQHGQQYARLPNQQ